jgi:hypothetical protein
LKLKQEKQYEPPSFDWILWSKWILVTTLGWLIGWSLIRFDFGIGIAIGILQWIVLRSLVRRAWWWILVTILGWIVGWGVIVLTLPPQAGILSGGILGLGVGVFQWLTLRQWFFRSWWWILTSTLGWALGLTGFLGESLVGAVVGAVTGFALELLLRNQRESSKINRDMIDAYS